MKKIILFSPNGYVGGFIKKRLEEDGTIQLYEITRGDNLEQYQTDYDVLIYSASITSVRHVTVDKYVQDNVVTAISMMGFCKKRNVKKVIYLSSDEIYGELNADKVTDKAVMVNPNLYAATKYLAEKIIMESGVSYYILRLPGVVGRIWRENFICNLMNKIRNDEQIHLYNMDRKFNNMLHIDDLTMFINLLCDKAYDERSEIFLLGNTEYVRLKDVVLYIKNLYQSKSDICNIETNQKKCFTLDVGKAMEYGYYSKRVNVILDELYRLREGVYDK